MPKTLVLYYSFEGRTAKFAKEIAAHCQADIQAITPTKELKSKGFSKYIVGGGQVVKGKKPELQPLNVDLQDYDIIFIGSPIWAGTYAPPIKTVLEGDMLHNKKIAYFYCNGGGAPKAEEKFKHAIEKDNSFLGALNIVTPPKDMENILQKAKEWATEIISKS